MSTPITGERVAAVVSLCLVVAAWVAGGIRAEDASLERIGNVSPELVGLGEVRSSVYEGHREGDPSETLRVGVAERPGYGGPVRVAVVVNGDDIIERVALLRTTDTSTYVDRVLREGVLDAFPGAEGGALPEVDAVTGATLTSSAMVGAVAHATALVRGTATDEAPIALSSEDLVKAALTLCLFGLAVFVSGRMFRWNRKRARLALLALSTVMLGFLWNALFSFSSLVVLMAGLWKGGLGSYATLIALVLALLVFFTTRKNLYCSMLCPFGAVQESLARITGCRPAKATAWMTWTARALALLALCAALYFRSPSDAHFGPFGMAFSFIGSATVFALTVLIALASLVVRRPWCSLMCPIGLMFGYLTFLRRWLRPQRAPHTAEKEV